MRAGRVGDVFVVACLTAVMICSALAAISTNHAHAASATTVITVDFLSATNIDASGCLANTPDVTNLGTVLPSATATTGTDCTVVWGSSNDTSMLRMYQRDGVNSTLGRTTWGAQTSGVGSSLNKSASLNASTVWVVGNGGTILKTTDSGAT